MTQVLLKSNYLRLKNIWPWIHSIIASRYSIKTSHSVFLKKWATFTSSGIKDHSSTMHLRKYVKKFLLKIKLVQVFLKALKQSGMNKKEKHNTWGPLKLISTKKAKTNTSVMSFICLSTNISTWSLKWTFKSQRLVPEQSIWWNRVVTVGGLIS